MMTVTMKMVITVMIADDYYDYYDYYGKQFYYYDNYESNGW